MDGVLVDSGELHRAAWRAMLAEIGEAAPAPEFWRHTIGRPAHEAVSLLFERALTPAEAMRLAQRKQDHYARMAHQGPVPVPGVIGFVEALAARRVPRAVATSASRRDADRVLRGLGVARHFGVVVTADDVQRGKPDPEVYLTAAEGLGLAPGACLVFEDAIVGVQAAHDAGMRVIGVATAHRPHELRAAGAERVIASFEELAWPP